MLDARSDGSEVRSKLESGFSWQSSVRGLGVFGQALVSRAMSTTPWKLMCFCYSGGECMANADGGLGKYIGGVSEATVIEEGISFEELVVKVCSRMNMSPDGKLLFYSTSRDKSKHLRMRDADGVSMMFCLNEDEVDIFVEEEPLANTPRQCNISSRESNLLSSSPSIAAGEPSSTMKDNLTICHEMGLVPYSQRRDEDILSGDGQLFDNHRLFKKAVILFATLNKFTFKYLDNSYHYYRLACVVDGCLWKLTARAQGKSELIKVMKMNNEHCHTAQDNTNFKPRIRAKEMDERHPLQACDARNRRFVVQYIYLVDPFYRVEAQLLIYTTIMSPVPLHDMPSSTDIMPQVPEIQYGCEDLDISTSSSTAMEPLRPPATKRSTGRPKKKRIESQFQEKQTVYCGLCLEPGHNRSTCKSPLPR
ncbi:hypothetical protein RHMOL_Rhmol09G0112200 [Rhododendron molle]|uniref:Uncharacterized protein n=1 Tax=Rhododendron molle TaxID=49168 RepID=A0ACC0MDB8_RHOML|nr:hypothetical protein RHMOL_Rhmol09G0112200 [Rhododendron molle]